MDEAPVRLDRDGDGVAEQIFFSFSYQPTRGPDGAIDGILVQAFDVTERVRARRAAEAELRENEARYRTLAESAPIGIFHTDLLGRGVYANPYLCALAGLTPDRMPGHGWLAAIHPDDRAPLLDGWAAAAGERRTYEREARLVAPDGAVRRVLGRAEPVLSPTGELVGYVGTVADVTEQRRAEKERRRLATALARVDERERVAMDLHDGAVQSLVGLTLLLASAQGRVGADAEAERVLGEVRTRCNARSTTSAAT
jgi:two-component system sensor histidine kinase/response regulator